MSQLRDGMDELQARVAKWHDHNFGDVPETMRALIICEEAGELAHVVLKQAQGIRPETSSDDMLEDALGDILIASMALAASRGWSLGEIVERVAVHVLKRDWTGARK